MTQNSALRTQNSPATYDQFAKPVPSPAHPNSTVGYLRQIKEHGRIVESYGKYRFNRYGLRKFLESAELLVPNNQGKWQLTPKAEEILASHPVTSPCRLVAPYPLSPNPSLDDLWDIKHHGETRHASLAIYNTLQSAGHIRPDDTRIGGWDVTESGEALLAAPLVRTGPDGGGDYSTDYDPAPRSIDMFALTMTLLVSTAALILAAWSLLAAVALVAGWLTGWIFSPGSIEASDCDT